MQLQGKRSAAAADPQPHEAAATLYTGEVPALRQLIMAQQNENVKLKCQLNYVLSFVWALPIQMRKQTKMQLRKSVPTPVPGQTTYSLRRNHWTGIVERGHRQRQHRNESIQMSVLLAEVYVNQPLQ